MEKYKIVQVQDSARRESLTEGQETYAIILSCADSRMIPEMAFDTQDLEKYL